MAHLGVNSLPIVSLTLLFAGMVMTLQIVDILLRYGAQSTLGGVMSIAMGRELGPILTGVVVAGRVGAAMTAELGTMKVTEQITPCAAWLSIRLPTSSYPVSSPASSWCRSCRFTGMSSVRPEAMP